MEGPLWRLLIWSRSINNHGRHRQSLFQVGQFLNKSSPLKPLGQMNRDLVWSIYGRSAMKIAHLVPIRIQIWQPQAILVSGWLISKKSPPLKPLGPINRNLVWSIYGRSDIKIAHFVSMRLKTWPPQAILVSGWSISKQNLLLWNHFAKWTETRYEASMEGPLWRCLFHPDSLTNMAATGNSCFWLVNLWTKYSPLKPRLAKWTKIW